MATAVGSKLEDRVGQAAGAALDDRHFITAIDVLVGIGWLTTPQVNRWRRGQVDYLERVVAANLAKISTAMDALRRWAQKEGLKPSESAYLSRSRDHRPLRFSMSGDPRIEAAYRTHWVSPALSGAKQARLVEKQGRAPDLVVISPLKAWNCAECDGTGDLLFMEGAGPLCLECADLDQLVLPRSWCASVARGAATSARAFLSKKRLWPRRKQLAWLITTRAPDSVFARSSSDRMGTTPSKTLWVRRSFGFSPAVRRRGRRPSLPTPELGAAGGSAGAPPAGRSTPTP